MGARSLILIVRPRRRRPHARKLMRQDESLRRMVLHWLMLRRTCPVTPLSARRGRIPSGQRGAPSRAPRVPPPREA
jgi:hypothetical protein